MINKPQKDRLLQVEISLKYKLQIFDENTNVPVKSFIRNTKPDYVLKITQDYSPFERGSDERFFYLNYGDLFICATNSMETPKEVSLRLNEYSDLSIKFLKEQDEYLESIKSTGSGRLIDNKRYMEIYKKKEKALDNFYFNAALDFFIKDNVYSHGMFSAELGMLLSKDAHGIDIGSTTAEKLRENFAEHNTFSEIDVHISYQRDGSEEYTFTNGYSLVGFEVRQFIKHGKEIKICENCEKFFIPAFRSDEKYCDSIFKDNKTCKQISFSQRLVKDETLGTYRKIYKTQNARKQRNSHMIKISERFDEWSKYAITQRELCRNGDIPLSEMVQKISGDEWMNGGMFDATESDT